VQGKFFITNRRMLVIRIDPPGGIYATGEHKVSYPAKHANPNLRFAAYWKK